MMDIHLRDFINNAKNGNYHGIKIALERGLDPTKDEPRCRSKKLGQTALHKAALHGHKKIVVLLLKDFPRLLEMVDKLGKTALFLSSTKCIPTLLGSGANMHYSNPTGETPLMRLARRSKQGEVKCILNHARTLDNLAEEHLPIYLADKTLLPQVIISLIREYHETELERLIIAKSDLGITSLQFAIFHDHVKTRLINRNKNLKKRLNSTVKLLIDAGASVHISLEQEKSP